MKSSPSRSTFGKLTLLVVVVLAIAAGADHLAARWLGIRWTVGFKEARFGDEARQPLIFAVGSSLAFHGIDWELISTNLQRRVKLVGAPSASPCELQSAWAHRETAEVSIMGISIYDMNDHYLSDFLPEFLPLGVMVGDLWQGNLDWHFSMRVLGRYMNHYCRVVFPTAGRSATVLNNVRENFRSRLGSQVGAQNDAGEALGLGQRIEFSEDKVSAWPEGRLLRNLSRMRVAGEGKQAFSGPKRAAMERMIPAGAGSNSIVVLIMPVSPTYQKNLLRAADTTAFEAAVNRLQQLHPEVIYIRLDHLAELQADELFSDLVHLNRRGTRLATDELKKQLVKILKPQ